MIIMRRNRYLLVTPAKNEAHALPALIRSIVQQTVVPILWLIVDDGSTDNTSEIIKNAEKEYAYIKGFKLPEGKRDLGLKYSYVCKVGFEHVIQLCAKEEIDWHYIALLDADIIIGINYFEDLMIEFEKNPRLGIASGDIYCQNENEFYIDYHREDLPRGANRIWRRKCFEDTNGFTITYAPDTVSNIKAKLQGWDTKKFGNIMSRQIRPTSSAEGLWKGYKIRGKTTYYLCYHPIHVIFRGVKYLMQPKFYLSFAYFYGYLKDFVLKQPRTEDEVIKAYFRKYGLKDTISVYTKGTKHDHDSCKKM